MSVDVDFSVENITMPKMKHMENKKWFKNKKTDKIWWLDNYEKDGEWIFSFDKKTTFNMFRDYPHKLTPEQKEIFDKENPYWKNFFSDRSMNLPDLIKEYEKNFGGVPYEELSGYSDEETIEIIKKALKTGKEPEFRNDVTY